MTSTDQVLEIERAMVLDALAESYGGPAWHGPSVREALEGVDARAASYRIAPERNTIRELVLHLAHGRHLVIERINDAKLPAFPRAIREPWWPVTPTDIDDAAWRADVDLLHEYQQKLIDAATRASDAQLARLPTGSDHSVVRQLLGMALHDTYHAGQIRLLALAAK